VPVLKIVLFQMDVVIFLRVVTLLYGGRRFVFAGIFLFGMEVFSAWRANNV